MRFGAVFRYRKSYGAVRCCDISYGAVRCCDISYGVVRCGFAKIGNPTVRFGAVFRSRNLTVRFSEKRNPTVRFGAVFRYRKSYGAVRCGFHKSEIPRCGSARFPVERFFLRCGSTLRRTNRVTPLFLYGAPYERTAVSYCSHDLSRSTKETVVSLRCTVLLTNRTLPRFRTVLTLFAGAPTKPLFLCGYGDFSTKRQRQQQ